MSFRSYVVSVLCLTFALSSCAWAQRTASRVQFVDRIVAVVNNDIITQYELNERIRVVKNQLEGQKIQLPPQDVLEKQLLERMINEREYRFR